MANCVCLPPVERVDDREYVCRPAPKIQPDYSPVIGTNELTHYFLNPNHLDIPQRSIYNQLPKRAEGKLMASPEEAQLGWGIHFEEGWRWGFIYSLLVTSTIPPLIFGVVWSVYKDDIQGGFAIASSWMALGPLLLGYMAVRDYSSA